MSGKQDIIMRIIEETEQNSDSISEEDLNWHWWSWASCVTVICHENDRDWNHLQHVCCLTSWDNLIDAEKKHLYFATNSRNWATTWNKNKSIIKFKKSNFEVLEILNNQQQKAIATWLDCLHIFKHSSQREADENSSWQFICRSFQNWKDYRSSAKKVLLAETPQEHEELCEDLQCLPAYENITSQILW